MFIILIVATVSGVYAYAQTHQIAYIKYVQFFVYQLHLNKAVLKKKRPGLHGTIQGSGNDLG